MSVPTPRMSRFPSSSSSRKKALKTRMASVRHQAERTATPSASELRRPPEKQNRRTSQVPGAATSLSLPRAAAAGNTPAWDHLPPVAASPPALDREDDAVAGHVV